MLELGDFRVYAACTIAIRYSAVRLQGYDESGEEAGGICFRRW